MEKRLLTAAEAAKYLQVAEATVLLYAREKRLPCVRVGGRVRFRQEDLERGVAAPRKEGTPWPEK
jgi:excisionase family DNA binding protein